MILSIESQWEETGKAKAQMRKQILEGVHTKTKI